MNEVELGPKAFWILIAAGVLSGIVSWWAFRRWSDTAKLHKATNSIVARLFELRLFSDEPVLILRAQRSLLAANGELLRQLARPSLLLALPFIILLIGLDAIFGRAPLQPGRPAIVTLQYGPVPRNGLPQAELDAPSGIQVETPPVRVPTTSQISWRVRPTRAALGKLQIHCDGRLLQKSISSASGLQWLSASRAGSATEFLLAPLELPFSDPVVKSISVRYPRATVFNLSWVVWFSMTSFAGALVSAIAAYSR